MNGVKFLMSVAVLFAASAVHADPGSHKLSKSVAAASCRIVEEASRAHQLPVSVLTRLIWTESRFQPGAISRAGAQGVAQFMPGTSDERGLKNPFDPEQAIPEAAKLLADLGRKFGNAGLAIAAYNAGPGRVASWLDGTGALPHETGIFVLAITGRSAGEWATSRSVHPRAEEQSCVALQSILRDHRLNGTDGRILPGMEQSGDVLPSMRQSGRLLPEIERTGRILPSLRERGRILPRMRQSGRLLIGGR